jgi:putative ABC transport system substrate-binding protein
MSVMMQRRAFIMLLGGAAAAWPLGASAQQQAPKAARIGWLKIQDARHTPSQLQAFRDGMRALGLVEGRDYVFEERYADGHESQLPTLTAELLGTDVKVRTVGQQAASRDEEAERIDRRWDCQ